MFSIESLSACCLKSKALGVIGNAWPIRSSRTMMIVTPAGPRFFCAPPYSRPYFETSIGFDMKFDDTSATSGTSPTSGVQWYSTPPIVSFAQMWT